MFTRIIRVKRIADIGGLLRESPFIVFVRLGKLRATLPADIAEAMEMRMEMLASPIIDCDDSGLDWGSIEAATASFGRVIEGLDESRPFIAGFESERLRDTGVELVPCRVAYVDLGGDGLPSPEAVGSATLEAFGEIYAWVLDREKEVRNRAKLPGVLAILSTALRAASLLS